VGESFNQLKPLTVKGFPLFSVGCDHPSRLNPIQVRYQTAPRPDALIVHHWQRGVNPLNLYFLAEWALTPVENNLTYQNTTVRLSFYKFSVTPLIQVGCE